MNFRFDIDKSIAAAAYLIQKAGGRYDMFVLIKTLYFADRTALEEFGRTITGDKLVSMNKGPVLSGIYDLIKGKNIRNHPEALPKWNKFISEKQSFMLSIKAMPEIGYLSVREIEVIDKAFQTISNIPPYWLAEWTHQVCPEWENPEGSSRDIDATKILKNAKKSAQEIAEIEEEISSINTLKSLLA